MQGNFTTVAKTLHNLTELQALDLSGNAGLTGSLVATADTASDGICALVKKQLVYLNLEFDGLTGSIPGCVLGPGSSLQTVSLGAGPQWWCRHLIREWGAACINSTSIMAHLGEKNCSAGLVALACWACVCVAWACGFVKGAAC